MCIFARCIHPLQRVNISFLRSLSPEIKSVHFHDHLRYSVCSRLKGSWTRMILRARSTLCSLTITPCCSGSSKCDIIFDRLNSVQTVRISPRKVQKTKPEWSLSRKLKYWSRKQIWASTWPQWSATEPPNLSSLFSFSLSFQVVHFNFIPVC